MSESRSLDSRFFVKDHNRVVRTRLESLCGVSESHVEGDTLVVIARVGNHVGENKFGLYRRIREELEQPKWSKDIRNVRPNGQLREITAEAHWPGSQFSKIRILVEPAPVEA